MRICGLEDVPCLNTELPHMRTLAFPAEDFLETLTEAGIECNCPAGNRYKIGCYTV